MFALFVSKETIRALWRIFLRGFCLWYFL